MTLCNAIEPLPSAQDAAFYGEDLLWMEGAIGEFLLRLDMLRRLRLARGERDPVEHYKARIKSARSMREKLARQGLPADAETARTAVHDGAGVRIVCPFVDDIQAAAGLIRRIAGVEVLREKDYVAAPKPNGYRSHHMILRYPVAIAAETRPVYLEVQLRTIAMDCWACLEHQMKYKQEIPDARLIAGELKECAEGLASADLSMQAIRDWIAGENQEVYDG